MNLRRFGKTVALSILDKSRHRGHDLWMDLKFFSKAIGREDDSNLLFIDVGANIGQTTDQIRSKFPNSIIHAFEPHETSFSKLLSRFKGQINVHCHNVGCGDTPGSQVLYIGEHSTISTFVKTDRSFATQRAELITIDQFLVDHNIKSAFLLKSDTEGFDLNVLRGATESLRRGAFDYVLIETRFHITMELPQSSFEEVSAFLASFRYHFCHPYEVVYNTKGGQALWCNALFTRH